ncbi:MAG TPA: hypothetical protein VFZ70_12820 [Euzebyales bacterium]
MRKTVRLFSTVGPAARLGTAIASLPVSVQRALAEVAERTDLALVAGSWSDDDGGCLVANVVRSTAPSHSSADRTLDLRMLDAFPQMSSRDLNLLIVAWDEAAAQAVAASDDDLRSLLRSGLAWAGVELVETRQAADVTAPPPGGSGGGAVVGVRVTGSAR